MRGSCGRDIPATLTVSVCAHSISDAPPPCPRATPTTLGRSPGPSSETSRPRSRSQSATKPAISRSPAAPGTSAGLTESIDTRSASRSMARSVLRADPRGQHRLPVALQLLPVLLETRELRYFVAVAEAGRFTHAAKTLHIAQQSLSAAIAQMERR